MENGLFFFFSGILLISVFSVITTTNLIYSVLFLISTFVSASFILFLLECDFLAFIFIMVYVGAITILFLFALMLLNFKANIKAVNFVKYFPLGSFIGVILLFEILSIIYKSFPQNEIPNSLIENNFLNWYSLIDKTLYIELLGQSLYTHYVLQFLVSGIILLLAVIGVTVLTRKH